VTAYYVSGRCEDGTVYYDRNLGTAHIDAQPMRLMQAVTVANRLAKVKWLYRVGIRRCKPKYHRRTR
jgi:hypothetical protein